MNRLKIAAISALAIAGWATVGMVAVADYIDTDNPADCTVEYPSFEEFEDGSSGCFEAEEGALSDEWLPGEYEVAILTDDDYDLEEVLSTFTAEELADAKVYAAENGIDLPNIDPPSIDIKREVIRPNLPKTGN